MFAVRIQGIKAVRNSLIEETEMSPSQRVLYPDTLLIEAFVTNKLKQMEFALAVALMAILEKFHAVKQLTRALLTSNCYATFNLVN